MARKSPEEILQMRAEMLKGDPTFWRHPVAEAVLELFAEGKAVTPESMIAHLQEMRHPDDVMLRGAQLEAAIDRLRKVIMQKD
ncbi:hypothetical protein [Mycoplana ramosa]|uniref:Uncharacterized protein n=1 Tax=Mycoplana ramosa TaxID=40837 RepID=A0ABW3Z1V1_MYCRA